MEHTQFVFGAGQFNRLFPFYILLDKNLCIKSFGSSLAKICPLEVGKSFNSFFRLKRPSLPLQNTTDIQNIAHQLLSLEILLEKPIILRGQFEYLPTEDAYLFVGSPWFYNMEEVKEHRLLLSDFATHDAMIDLLHVLKTQEIALEDTKLMFNKINAQVNLLKQNQTELQRLSLVAKANKNGVIFTDTEGRITWHNDGFSELLMFYSWEVLGERALNVCKGYLTQRAELKKILIAYKAQESIKTELILHKKNKSWFWASIEIQPIKDSAGKLKEYFAIIEDITEKKLAEETIKASENRLASLISNFQSGILLEDETRHIVLTNQKFCEMFAIPASPALLVGADCSKSAEESKDFFQNSEAFLARIGEVLAHRKPALGDVLELKNGQIYERDYIPIFLDKVYKGHLWVYTDVTEQKNAEKNLIKQEEKYRNIIANMNLGLLEVDLEENILYANQSFCDISGYSFEELVGKNASMLFAPLEAMPLLQAKNKLRALGLSDMYEIHTHNKAQEKRWWLVSGAPRYDENGKHIGSIGIHLDITEQKKVEAELEVARKKAEESAIAKELFLANMSHEIRTPLNAIIGMARELAKTNLDRQQNTYLKHTFYASQHLLSIVNNILDISKIEAGQLQLEVQDFKMQDILRQVETILAQSAKEKMLDFKVMCDETIAPALLGDAVRIRQILLNILSNAVKFTEKGEVGISCLCRASEKDKQILLIHIWDTGIGMDAGYIEKLFSKFSQENSAISRKYGGTGLGMAIARELVQLMGGEISVKSEKGAGTHFEISLTLPIGNEQRIEKDAIDPIKDVLFNKRILLVEDNELNRLVATNTLSHYRVKITEAVHGQEAVDILQKQSFDAILMDLQMPIMDGLEATKIIRTQLKLQTPIVASTANAFKTEVERCMEAGMNEYITKPFEENMLLGVLHKVLSLPTNLMDSPETKQASEVTSALCDLSKIWAMSKGNKAFVKKMLDLFIEHTPPAVEQIKLAYETQDFATMRKTAHRIKPSFDNLRVAHATEDVRILELYGENDLAYEDAKIVIERLERIVMQVVETLQKEDV
jgi:PAS domain S-box-containing protein